VQERFDEINARLAGQGMRTISLAVPGGSGQLRDDLSG
jgi:hypothetical protein